MMLGESVDIPAVFLPRYGEICIIPKFFALWPQ